MSAPCKIRRTLKSRKMCMFRAKFVLFQGNYSEFPRIPNTFIALRMLFWGLFIGLGDILLEKFERLYKINCCVTFFCLWKWWQDKQLDKLETCMYGKGRFSPLTWHFYLIMGYNIHRCFSCVLYRCQTKPLIPLQSEIDPETDRKVLTCYLLPQGAMEQNSRSSHHCQNNFHGISKERKHLASARK